MICCFSATGNSRHVATRLAESLNESVTSIRTKSERKNRHSSVPRFVQP